MRVSVRRADEPVATGTALASTRIDSEHDTFATPQPAEDNGPVRVESPMVGVFYRAPNPGAPAFVDVGDPVVPGQTLCVLEAMKLFNELKAEVAGTVASIHVENAEAVEYGQLLFEIEPALEPPTL
jgi:acetyl-CoA carboxylase biotin carboxyl carrier protein